MWFTSTGDYTVGRLTPDGELTTFSATDIPGPPLLPAVITRGPDDNLWFTESGGRVLRINQAGTITSIVSLGEDTRPLDITTGADGGLWITERNANRIARVSALAFSFLQLGGGSAPTILARDTDDTIWFSASGGNRVGFFTRTGSLVQHELGGGHTPVGITVAPDGRAWFVDQENNTVGVISREGELIEYAIPTESSFPQDITRGPDGNFWFTETDGSKVGRITPEGVITEFPTLTANSGPQSIALGAGRQPVGDPPRRQSHRPLHAAGRASRVRDPDQASEPFGIAAGPDGQLYFTQYAAGRVARITTDGVVTELGTPAARSYPFFIAPGPDGAMWFTENGANRLGRIARDGRITKFDIPLSDSFPTGLVGRSDGFMLFALFNADRIGGVELAAAEPTHTVNPTPTRTPISPGDECAGDCDLDLVVTVSELITGVNIALGNAAVATCPLFDRDTTGAVEINELIVAVSNLLNGCPA